jgi:hypothetical protein
MEQPIVQQPLIRSLMLSAMIVLLSLSWMMQDARGQEASPTPVFEPPDVIKAFEFYPAESGLGSFFAPTIEAGSTARLTALIANTGEVVQYLRTYTNNAFTADGGGFGAAEYGTPPNDVTSWLNYPEETFTIEPGQGIERTFSIKVPEGTAPGQYITAVAAEDADVSAVEGSENFTQRLRYVVPVFITVPGETTAGFTVGDITLTVESDVILVQIGLENTGDVRVRPEGTVDLLDHDGNLIVSFPVTMESIYAHEATTLTLGAAGVIPSGTYQVQVNLTDPDTGETAAAEASGLVAETAATPEPVLISIASASATPLPDADNVQFVSVEAVISNNDEPIANAQLTLVASRDGEEIERFPISQSLALPTGETPISTRYLPLEGWSSGTWTFELLLETVDPTGASVVLGRMPIEGTVEIP